MKIMPKAVEAMKIGLSPRMMTTNVLDVENMNKGPYGTASKLGLSHYRTGC